MNTPNTLKLALFLCAVACSIVTGTLLAFFRSRSAFKAFSEDADFRRSRGLSASDRRSLLATSDLAKRAPRSKTAARCGDVSNANRKKVEDYLRDSQALEAYGQKPITPEELQAEMDRIALNTKQPEMCGKFFKHSGTIPSSSRNAGQTGLSRAPGRGFIA